MPPRRTPRALRTPFALTVLSTLLLAACGGGGGGGSDDDTNTATTERETRATASLGYLVPEGQAELVVSLSNCVTYARNVVPRTDTPVTSATLTLRETGDVVFSGAVGSASSPSTLAQVTATEASEREIGFRATNRANNAGISVRYDFEVSNDNAADAFDAYTFNDNTGELVVTVDRTTVYACTIAANAFSLPATLTATRLAQITAGATGASEENLWGEPSLIATSTSATWDGATSPPWNELDSNDRVYSGSRYIRLDWSGITPTLSTSDRRNGTFTPRSLPPSSTDAREYTSAYEEFSSNIGRYANTPAQGITARVTYPADPAASYSFRVGRVLDRVTPEAELSGEDFRYTSTRGDLNGLPNAFYTSNTPIPLSTCTSGGLPVQRRIVFTSDQRIIWLDGDNNEIVRFTPDDTARQRRVLSVAGGTSTTVSAAFKIYADGVAEVRDMPSQKLEIYPISDTIEVEYPNNGGTSREQCAAPTLGAQPDLIVNSRIASVLDFGGNTSVMTNTTSYTCSGDSSPTSWRHTFTNSGQFATETTLPGNTPSGNFVDWAGGTNWVGQANGVYEETYDASVGSVSAATRIINNAATTVRPGCFSALSIQGDSTSGLTLVSFP